MLPMPLAFANPRWIRRGRARFVPLRARSDTSAFRRDLGRAIREASVQ
jgi:hypothetical protein